MDDVTPEEAIARARAALGIGRLVPALAHPVHSLDEPGSAYYLVVFGEERAALGVATVDAGIGEVRTSARLTGLRAHLSIGAEDARRLANLPEPARVSLAWKPCRASLSPLYPFWEVRTESGTLYVDQSGGVWKELAPAGPGG